MAYSGIEIIKIYDERVFEPLSKGKYNQEDCDYLNKILRKVSHDIGNVVVFAGNDNYNAATLKHIGSSLRECAFSYNFNSSFLRREISQLKSGDVVVVSENDKTLEAKIIGILEERAKKEEISDS